MIRSRQQQEVKHSRLDKELLFCPSEAAKMEPGHSVLHLGIGEQPFNVAPQPHRSLEKARSHFRPREIARVFVLHTAQPTVTSARALLAQGTCLAVVRSRGASMHSGRTVKTAVREHVSCRTSVTVAVPMVSERFARELTFGLLGALDHRNVGHRPAITHEGEERGAAISLVSGDPRGPVIEPISGSRQHIASRVHLVRETGGCRFDIERGSTRGVDQDIEGITEPPSHGASRPSRGRIGARHTWEALGHVGERHWSPRPIGQPLAHRAGRTVRVRQVYREYLALPARIRGDERCVNRGVFAGDQPLLDAAPDSVLEQQTEHSGIAEAAVPVLAKGRMMRDRCTCRKTTEPAVSEIVAQLLAQSTLRPDSVDASDQCHPDQQLGINRGSTAWTVMLRQRSFQLAQVEQPVDTAKKVVAQQHAIYGAGARPGPSIIASRAHHGAAPSFLKAKHRKEINVSGVFQQPRAFVRRGVRHLIEARRQKDHEAGSDRVFSTVMIRSSNNVRLATAKPALRGRIAQHDAAIERNCDYRLSTKFLLGQSANA
jgi:hypothetical protein